VVDGDVGLPLGAPAVVETPPGEVVLGSGSADPPPPDGGGGAGGRAEVVVGSGAGDGGGGGGAAVFTGAAIPGGDPAPNAQPSLPPCLGWLLPAPVPL